MVSDVHSHCHLQQSAGLPPLGLQQRRTSENFFKGGLKKEQNKSEARRITSGNPTSGRNQIKNKD